MECVRLLISDDRTDPNIRADYNIFSDTLTLAVKCHYVEIVELLIRDKRIDPNIKDYTDGSTPLLLAIKENLEDCVKLILSDPRVDLGCESIEEGHPELVAGGGGETEKKGCLAFSFQHLTVAPLSSSLYSSGRRRHLTSHTRTLVQN